MAEPTQRIERRLAAIFAADVAGYSRLMNEDEVGTLRTLTAHRKPRSITRHAVIGRQMATAGHVAADDSGRARLRPARIGRSFCASDSPRHRAGDARPWILARKSRPRRRSGGEAHRIGPKRWPAVSHARRQPRHLDEVSTIAHPTSSLPRNVSRQSRPEPPRHRAGPSQAAARPAAWITRKIRSWVAGMSMSRMP